MPTNDFIGTPIADLQELKVLYFDNMKRLNREYALNGRSTALAELSQVKAAYGEIMAEISALQGGTTNVTRISYTGL